MAQEFDTIVFDLGGVLIDWNPNYVFEPMFEDKEELTHFFKHVCTPDWNELQDAGRLLKEATEVKVREFPSYEVAIRAYYGRWTEMIGGAFIETVEILENLRKTNEFQLLALTNWSHETWPYAVENFEFLTWFDGIMVSGQEKMKKPDPAFYKLLADRYDLTIPKTIFIDDNKRNIESAREFGFCSIHFTSPYSLEDELRILGVL
jgi:2-haloacid dehalogenase